MTKEKEISANVELPEWAKAVRQKYLAGEASIFVLYGNVFDGILGPKGLVSLSDFLANTLLGGKKNVILSVDPSQPPENNPVISGSLPVVGTNETQKNTLSFTEKVIAADTRVGVIVPYASSLAPAGDETMLSPYDRMSILTLHRWSMSRYFKDTDNVLFLITESLAELHPKLVSNPRICHVQIELPNKTERAELIKFLDGEKSVKMNEHLAEYTSGLRLVQIEHLLKPNSEGEVSNEEREKVILDLLANTKDAAVRAKKLVDLTKGMSLSEIHHLVNPDKVTNSKDEDYQDVLNVISQRKKEIIETECSGLLEFMNPSFDLDAVGGNEGIKEELFRIANAIKSGDFKRAPMGLMFVGAMGCGKTFIAKAFAKSSGLPAVTLKNFRSKWVGSTEANLDKVLSLVKTLGPVIVVIDEGDRAFGGEEGETDGGTSSRIMARLKEFMSDTSNRGRVLFILMTNRPDKLDIDIKRAGRVDVKIPLFYPQTGAEVKPILLSILKRLNIKSDFQNDLIFDKLKDYSNADIETVCLLAMNNFAESDGSLSEKSLNSAIEEYMPTKDTKVIEFMEMLAVSEASRKSMLPEKYKTMSSESITKKLAELKVGMRR